MRKVNPVTQKRMFTASLDRKVRSETKEKAEELGLNLGSFRRLCYGLIPGLKGYALQNRQEIQSN